MIAGPGSIASATSSREPSRYCSPYVTTLTAISTFVTVPVAIIARPPNSVRAAVVLAPSRTHSGHWNPTAAGIMQSGQIGRPHRWQTMCASRSGCR